MTSVIISTPAARAASRAVSTSATSRAKANAALPGMALESASAWPAMSYSIHYWPGLAQSETRIGALSHLNPAPGDQLQNQDDEGNNEQNVNQTARDMKTQAKRPKNKKNYQDVPKHKIEVLFSVGLRLMNRRRPVPRMPPSPYPHLSESQRGAASSPILERRPSTHLTRSVCAPGWIRLLTRQALATSGSRKGKAGLDMPCGGAPSFTRITGLQNREQHEVEKQSCRSSKEQRTD